MIKRLKTIVFSRLFLTQSGTVLSALSALGILSLFFGIAFASDLEDGGFLIILSCWIYLFLIPASLIRMLLDFWQMRKSKARLWFLLCALIILLSVILACFNLEQVYIWQKICRGYWNLSEKGYSLVLRLSSLPPMMYSFFGLQLLSGLLPLREKKE